MGTENDFGTQGLAPTHPELLDYLAATFVQGSGKTPWSLKAMHRLIVTSAAYRQSSHARPDAAAKDPYNKLLARQSRIRLEAETIRDAGLTASGLLAREIGGPGVYPPQPEGIYAFTQQRKFWPAAEGDDRYRRGLYTYFWRSSPYPFLMTFDAPDANAACTRRIRSNTPLQALTLANDRAFVEMAETLAARVLKEKASTDADRIAAAFRRCMAREPQARELATLEQFLQSQRTAAKNEPVAKASPSPLAGEGGSTAKAGESGEGSAATVVDADRIAWTAVARVLLNLDEFITRE